MFVDTSFDLRTDSVGGGGDVVTRGYNDEKGICFDRVSAISSIANVNTRVCPYLIEMKFGHQLHCDEPDSKGIVEDITDL